MNTMNDNKPTLASARLDQMIEFALSHAQEPKKGSVFSWPRLTIGFGGLAMAASVAGVLWLSPTMAPTKAPSLNRPAVEISDYLIYETLEDLS